MSSCGGGGPGASLKFDWLGSRLLSVIGCLAAILRLSDGLFRAAGAETYAEGDMRRAQMRGYWRLLSWYQVGGWCVWILGVWPR